MKFNSTRCWLSMNAFALMIVLAALSYDDKELASVAFPAFSGLYWALRAAIQASMERPGRKVVSTKTS